MEPRLFTTAAALGFLGVLARTFGAHGLRDHVPADLFAAFEIGVRYHLVHVAPLLAVGIAAGAEPRPRMAIMSGWLLVGGILVFSGSLYVLAITGARWVGLITPIGGVMLLLGWGTLALWAARCAAADRNGGEK